jgi:Flp pilus assembly secretin CpaC
VGATRTAQSEPPSTDVTTSFTYFALDCACVRDCVEVVLMRTHIGLIAAAAFVMTVTAPPSASAANLINVMLDRATITSIPKGTATIVIGDPLIADVHLVGNQAPGVMIVTGKGYGVTNVIALDNSGRKLDERLVQVLGPAESVVVYRGVTRESYSCAPDCERRITLGDTAEFFNNALSQVTSNRTQQNQVTAAPPGGAPGR